MAGETVIGPTSDQAVKRWSQQLMRETFGKMAIRGLIGRSNDAFIKMHTDLNRDAGDNIKFDLRQQSRDPGVSGDDTLEQNESQLVFWQDEVNINQKRNANAYGRMSQQRTVHDLRREARDNMSNWFAWGLESGMLAHLAGTTGASNESSEAFLYETTTGSPTTGTDKFGNDVTAMDANHTVDGSAGPFSMNLVEDVVAKAKTVNPRVAPGLIDGERKYVLLMHPYAVRSMRSQLDQVNVPGWIDSQRRAGARGDANPIWTGATGEYNGCILVENEFVPWDPNGGGAGVGISYNIMLGACGGAIAFGNAWDQFSSIRANGGGSAFSYIEDIDDYDNRRGYGVASVTGFKRCIFESGAASAEEAFGAMLVTSQDDAPA